MVSIEIHMLILGLADNDSYTAESYFPRENTTEFKQKIHVLMFLEKMADSLATSHANIKGS